MDDLERKRVERRQAQERRKEERAREERRNLAAGNPGDVDFIGLVRKWRQNPPDGLTQQQRQRDAHVSEQGKNSKICICVRKRPVSDKERAKKDHDSVTVRHPYVTIHACKTKVDGISKYLDHNTFNFDQTFGEEDTTDDVYEYTTMGLVDFVCSGVGGRATCFAYGQTGSGKTYTMNGLQVMVAEDIFMLLGGEGAAAKKGCTNADTVVTVSFFELYGGRCQDLLNDRHRLKILEDGKGEVVITELEEFEAADPDEFLTLVQAGNRRRTTHQTEANDTSSRSHAVCQILLRDRGTGKLRGKLSLVDLAGSERGSDTKSHNRQRRTESSEINKSLLALKECIRALDTSNSHIPYRASKLTLVLKDCFTSSLARTTMIATVSPGSHSADHTINTLRYADRIKEKKVKNQRSAAAVAEEKRDQQALQRAAYEQRRELRSKLGEYDHEDDNQLPMPPPEEKKRRAVKSHSGAAGTASAGTASAGRGEPGGGREAKREAAAPRRRSKSPIRKERPQPVAANKSPVRAQRGQPQQPQKHHPKIESHEHIQPPTTPNRRNDRNDDHDDDIHALHRSLKKQSIDDGSIDYNDGGDDEAKAADVEELHRTVQLIFEKEEDLLNYHMSAIQESAELLTQEGRLLQAVQSEDEYEIDGYVEQLEKILERKSYLISKLSSKLKDFRKHLKDEEVLSNKVSMPAY